ncbi:unnamed protein product [Closterium sp. NIES-53]
MTPSSYKPQEPRYSDVEQCHTVPNHEGSRNYPPQGPTPREMLHYTNTAFLQGSLHEEIWLRCPPGFTGSFPPGTQWSLRRPVYGLRQAPREWHDTLRTTLVALGFAPSTADPLLFLRTDTSLPPFYILVYVDDLVFATADTAGLAHVNTSGLGLVLGGRRPVVLTGHADASWADDQATQRSSQGYTFSLGSGSVSWRSTRSSSVLGSSCEAEIYAGAMAAQELRWLTYLLTDLGEQPHSPPVLYVDNKAMLALCREHRLEHRTKHIALHYFLARELQQRGQLRLAYVASQANTADIFTKALPPGDHQRFCTMLACFALLDWSCDLLFSPTFPMGLKSLPRFQSPSTLLSDIFAHNAATMALNGENSDNANASIRPDDGNITREPAGERRNKSRADDEESTPTAVDILLSDVAGARASGVPRAQVAPEGPEALAVNECAKSTPASASGTPRQRQCCRQAHTPDARPQAHVGPDAPQAPDAP